ncbi:MAG: hypothetical protein HY913_13670 [Desulfomonile tiedjei]|nr:hypothetical protein [Desulfomonile tiedjei]
MLSLQILALTLIPVLSGVVPTDGSLLINPSALLGIEESITAEFMTGTWKYSEEFFRWGVTDKDKAKVKPFRGNAFMSLDKDGAMKMANFFRPEEGRWELTQTGILIYDPRYPERGSQILPVRKRDKDRIWVLLPFTGGATGIGMVRVPDEEFVRAREKSDANSTTPRKSTRRQGSSPWMQPQSSDAVTQKPAKDPDLLWEPKAGF